LWDLIKSYQVDIKEWVTQSVKKEIEELKQKQLKGRGGKAGEKRAEDIRKKTERLAKIETVKSFLIIQMEIMSATIPLVIVKSSK